MRSGNTLYKITKDSTWRIAYQAFWPAALTATTKFTHLMQMKVQDVGGPLWTLTPRLKDKPKLTILTLKDNDANTEHVLADYAPLQDKWIDLQFEATWRGRSRTAPPSSRTAARPPWTSGATRTTCVPSGASTGVSAARGSKTATS
jgi:hypothetical protein